RPLEKPAAVNKLWSQTAQPLVEQLRTKAEQVLATGNLALNANDARPQVTKGIMKTLRSETEPIMNHIRAEAEHTIEEVREEAKALANLNKANLLTMPDPWDVQTIKPKIVFYKKNLKDLQVDFDSDPRQVASKLLQGGYLDSNRLVLITHGFHNNFDTD